MRCMADYVTGMITDWKWERPNLDVSPLEVTSRILRAAQLLRTRLDEVTSDFGLSHKGDLDVLAGDLLLGLTLKSDSMEFESDQQLVRVESILALRAVLDPLATLDGSECDCWLLRDGKIVTTKIAVRRHY